MIVSPRRLILAITLAPPVIKIKQQLLCLTIHYMRIKNLGLFLYLHIVYKQLSAYTLHADKKLSAYTLYADKANQLEMPVN